MVLAEGDPEVATSRRHVDWGDQAMGKAPDHGRYVTIGMKGAVLGAKRAVAGGYGGGVQRVVSRGNGMEPEAYMSGRYMAVTSKADGATGGRLGLARAVMALLMDRLRRPMARMRLSR